MSERCYLKLVRFYNSCRASISCSYLSGVEPSPKRAKIHQRPARSVTVQPRITTVTDHGPQVSRQDSSDEGREKSDITS